MEEAAAAQPEGMSEVQEIELAPAGFWIRGGAYLIDGLILAIPHVIASLTLPNIVGIIFKLVVSGAYFTMMPVAFNGQTLGKMAAGIGVIRTDGSPLTPGRMLARWLGYLLSSIVVGMGFICAAFTPQKRALHDYLVDTRVAYIEQVAAWRKAVVIFVGSLFPLAMLLVVFATAMPKFSHLSALSKEGATKAHLGALRSALAIHYGDTEGKYPADPRALIPKYIQSIDPPTIADHPASAGIEFYGAEICGGEKGGDIVGARLRDTGKWGYVSDPKASCYGAVFVDCTHNDNKGKQWFTW